MAAPRPHRGHSSATTVFTETSQCRCRMNNPDPMTHSVTDLVYRVNALDEIYFTNSQYDEFAATNSGQSANSKAVLNRSLWDFITETSTRCIYQRILRRVRDGRAFRFHFRCDSADFRRMMEMSVVAVENLGVEFRTRIISQTPRPRQLLLDGNASVSNILVRMCGWCAAVDLNGTWIELEEAVLCMGLLERPTPGNISHGICEACHAKMEIALSASIIDETLPRSPGMLNN